MLFKDTCNEIHNLIAYKKERVLVIMIMIIVT